MTRSADDDTPGDNNTNCYLMHPAQVEDILCYLLLEMIASDQHYTQSTLMSWFPISVKLY